MYRVAQKWHSFWYALTSSNINWFSNLFQCQNQEKICSNTITKDPTTPKVGLTVTSCRSTWSSAGILHGCLRQGGAPSHTSRNTLTYLRRENVTFIEPHMWLPNSPDLNPVDCAVWGALQQMVYERRRYTRQSTSWCRQSSLSGGKLLQRFIDRAIGQWRRRLEWVVPQQGEQIEHLM